MYKNIFIITPIGIDGSHFANIITLDKKFVPLFLSDDYTTTILNKYDLLFNVNYVNSSVIPSACLSKKYDLSSYQNEIKESSSVYYGTCNQYHTFDIKPNLDIIFLEFTVPKYNHYPMILYQKALKTKKSISYSLDKDIKSLALDTDILYHDEGIYYFIEMLGNIGITLPKDCVIMHNKYMEFNRRFVNKILGK